MEGNVFFLFVSIFVGINLQLVSRSKLGCLKFPSCWGGGVLHSAYNRISQSAHLNLHSGKTSRIFNLMSLLCCYVLMKFNYVMTFQDISIMLYFCFLFCKMLLLLENHEKNVKNQSTQRSPKR